MSLLDWRTESIVSPYKGWGVQPCSIILAVTANVLQRLTNCFVGLSDGVWMQGLGGQRRPKLQGPRPEGFASVSLPFLRLQFSLSWWDHASSECRETFPLWVYVVSQYLGRK